MVVVPDRGSLNAGVPDLPPAPEALERLFRAKYGDPSSTGWSPRRRYKHGYFLPSDVYEAVVERLVVPGCRWLDVGGGHHIFPENASLARRLVARTSRCVSVDPDANTRKNDLVHERVQKPIEDYQSEELFDVATLRLVAEHITHPEAVLANLRRLMKDDGLIVVFTVNGWSPITLVSRVLPFKLHHPVKRLLWGGEKEDTFPTAYKMNTRDTLKRLFAAADFREVAFAYLDDLSAFGRFKTLNRCELLAWRLLRTIGIAYPENCLLGIYKR